MSNWQTRTLQNSEIAFIDGDRGDNYPQKSEFKKEGYCLFLNTGNVTKSGFSFSDNDFISKERDECLRKGKAQLDDIILTTRGTVGNVGYISKDIPYKNIRINSGMLILRTNPRLLNAYFLYLYLRSDLFKKQILKITSGSAQPQLPINSLQHAKIIFPDLDEQQKIVAVLSALDSKINVNNRINAELEHLAKTIYDYWFVQFDFPNEEGKPYKSSGGAMVYSPELKREIPAGWKVEKLGKTLKTCLGGTPSTKKEEYWNDGDIPWLNSGEIANFPVISSEKRITRKGLKNSPAELLPKGSLVLSIVRYIRPSVLGIDACANQSVLGVYESSDFKSSFIYPYFVNQVAFLMSLRTGAQQPHINKEVVDSLWFLIPDKTTLHKYYPLVETLFSKIFNLSFQNQQLTELRDWLLPLLMNGQVRVE